MKYRKEDLRYSILSCCKRRPKRGEESLRATNWKFNNDLKLINKERDVINIVNRVNVLELKAQEIEAVALAKIAQRNNQQTDSNDKVIIYIQFNNREPSRSFKRRRRA